MKILKERAHRMGLLFMFWLSVPLLGGLASWIDSGWSLHFTFFYFFFLHLFPLDWLHIALHGYTRPPSADEIWKDNFKYPAQYHDKWQLLLFPAQIGAFQFEKSKAEFLHAGFHIWEGRLVSLLCAIALKPDLLDGFHEDWGIPIRYQEIIFQFRLSWFWSTAITGFMFLNGRSFCGMVFLTLALLHSSAIAFFFLYNRYRMPGINSPTF